MDSAARWSVPVFVMISGALVLHSSSADDPLLFYRRRLSRVLPPLVAWSAIYLVYGHLATNNPKSLDDAVAYILAGRPYFHLYFLYLITGLYLIAPFLRPMVALPDKRVLGIAVLVLLTMEMADNMILISGHGGGANAVTRFVPYLGYFLAGAWLRELEPTRRRIVGAASIVVLGIGATAVGTDLLLANIGFGKGFYLYEYLSITTVPTSLAIFVLFAWSGAFLDRTTNHNFRRLLSVLASSTLGIYVVHPLVIQAFGTLGFGVRSFFVPLAALVSVLTVFLVSLVIVLVVRQMPGLRRLV